MTYADRWDEWAAARLANADTDWQADAKCAGMPADLFFPEQGSHTASSAGKKVCKTCPVTAACLEYAVVTRQLVGIWGGLTEEERRRMRRRTWPSRRELT